MLSASENPLRRRSCEFSGIWNKNGSAARVEANITVPQHINNDIKTELDVDVMLDPFIWLWDSALQKFRHQNAEARSCSRFQGVEPRVRFPKSYCTIWRQVTRWQLHLGSWTRPWRISSIRWAPGASKFGSWMVNPPKKTSVSRWRRRRNLSVLWCNCMWVGRYFRKCSPRAKWKGGFAGNQEDIPKSHHALHQSSPIQDLLWELQLRRGGQTRHSLSVPWYSFLKWMGFGGGGVMLEPKKRLQLLQFRFPRSISCGTILKELIYDQTHLLQ